MWQCPAPSCVIGILIRYPGLTAPGSSLRGASQIHGLVAPVVPVSSDFQSHRALWLRLSWEGTKADVYEVSVFRALSSKPVENGYL